ncbi:chromate efflux transporter [Thalassotalea fusca]
MNPVIDVFWRFLMLGCVSFGGPVAHIGYFQQTFVKKLKWIDEFEYGQLVGLSQFLPGPGSSQVGFALGLKRAGLLGGIAAFLGFTLPSFILLWLLSYSGLEQSENVLLYGAVTGLKLFAVVIVADATFSMFKSFCSERLTISIAVFSAFTLLAIPSLVSQILVLVIAAIVGVKSLQPADGNQQGKLRIHSLSLAIFGILFFVGLVLFKDNSLWQLFSQFYQAGSLVFGGGHVVLPLLQELVGEQLSADRFLLGYSAAQAVPGPMFSLASYLGAELLQDMPLVGALVATLGIFLPGFVLIYAFYRYWDIAALPSNVKGAMIGINAAVVGILFSALYQPVFMSAVASGTDLAIALLGIYALRVVRVPIAILVVAFALVGVALAM